jgi:hypothetical protein
MSSMREPGRGSHGELDEGVAHRFDGFSGGERCSEEAGDRAGSWRSSASTTST